MGTDNAQVYYSLDGMPIDNIRGFSGVPNGGVSTPRRVINRSKKSPGRRRSQLPDFTLTFERDVLEGAQDIDWTGMKAAQQSFVLTEHADATTRNYVDCEVETIAPAADDDGNATESITVSALDMDVF